MRGQALERGCGFYFRYHNGFRAHWAGVRTANAEFIVNHVCDGGTALAAIEGAALGALHRFGRARAVTYGLADGLVINASANANDHESQLGYMRMIFKCGMQRGLIGG